MSLISERIILELSARQFNDDSISNRDEAIEAAKTNISNFSKARVLRLTNCVSADEAIELLFELICECDTSPHLFIFIATVEEEGTVTLEKLYSLNDHINKPIIIQFAFPRTTQFFAKERVRDDFYEINLCNLSSLLDPSSLRNNNKFTLSWLLSFLIHKQGDAATENLLITNFNLSSCHFSGQTLLDHAVQHNSLLCLKILNLFEWDLERQNPNGLRILELAVQLGRYECLKILMEMTETDQIPRLGNYQRRLLSLTDNRDYSLMMSAVENDRTEIVKFLLCCNVDLNYKLKDNKTASDIAVNSEVLIELLKSDAPFPIDCSRIFGEEEFLELIHERTNYHKSVKSGKLDEVKRILKDNPNFKFLYNIKNQSALSTAIEHKQFEIYSFLRSQGFSSGIDQSLEALSMKLSIYEKYKIRESDKKYFRDSASDHILLLLSQSRLGFDSINHDELFEKIKKFYNDLDEIPEISPILKIAANSKNLRIVFDFNHMHVYDLDPSQRPNDSRSHVHHTIGDIFIGSGNDERNSVLGTIAHELTHFVMNEIYSNQCKPFVLNDEVESRLTEIYENVMEISSEAIIKSVGNYSQENRLAELIARVNHLLAFYKDSPSTEIDQLRQTHYKLFEFYDEITMPDLKRKCEEIKRSKLVHLNDLISNIPDGVKRLFNDDFDEEIVTTGLTVIVSDSPSSTFLKLYQSFMVQQLQNVVVFAKLESLDNKKYFDLIKSQLLLTTNSVLVVVQFESVLKENSLCLVSNIISSSSVQILITQSGAEAQISNVVPKFNFNFQHKWSDLTLEYQNELLKLKIYFHEKPISLGDIFNDPNCDSLKDLPIKEILAVECLQVNKPHNLLTTFYIKRTFVMHSKESKDILDESKLIELDTGETIVITDIAGMGKSVSLAHIASELIAKFPNHWVTFIDLKRYTESFTMENESLIQENFVDTFARKILELETQLEQRIFCHLYREGRVILLLDGFDEISPIYRGFLLMLIKAFHSNNKKNKLWITTRLHLLSELLKFNKSETYIELDPFSFSDQLEFLVQYWQSKSFEFSEQKKLEFENHANRILNKFIQSTVSDSLKVFIGVPLQIRMLAEIAEEKALSESQPMKIDFKDEINFYEFYERFDSKLLEIWLEKSNLTKKEIIKIMKSVDLTKIHQGAALSLYFGTKICELLKLPSINDDQKEMIVRIGILQMDEDFKITFIHLTFADFFLASFILEASEDLSKFNENLEHIFGILIDVLTADKHEKTRIFLDDAFDKFNFATISFNDSDLFQKVISNRSNFSILHQPIKFNQYNLLDFVFKLLTNSNGKIDPFFFKQLLLDKNLEKITALHLIFCHIRSEEFLKRIFKLLEATFENKEMKLIFNEKGHLGRNVFFQSLLHANENISCELLIYLETISTDRDELIAFLRQRDEQSNTVFHLIASQFKDVNSFNKIYDALAELLGLNIQKEMLTHKNISRNNVFLMSCFNDTFNIFKLFLEKLFIIFEPTELQTILTSIDERGSNALHLIKQNHVEALECLMKYLPPEVMKTMMFQKTIYGFTPFNYVLITSSDDQTVKSLWNIISKILPTADLKKILLEKIHSDRNILGTTCRNMNLDTWKTLFNIMTETLKLDELRDLILHGDAKKENILHVLGINTANVEIMKFVIIEAKKILTEAEFKTFLTANCQDKNTPLHAIVSFNDNPKVAEVFWSIIEQHFSLDEQREFLKHLGFARRHVMARSFESSNPSMAKTVWEIYKKIFDKETIEELFINANENIFDVASAINNPFCVDLLEWSKDNMDPKRFEPLLTERNDRGSTMLIDFICTHDANFIETLLVFIKKSFNIEIIKNIIYGTDTKGNNALISCLQSKHKSVVAVYNNFLRTVLSTGELDRYINEKNNDGKSFLDYIESNRMYRQECGFILEKSMEMVLESFHALAFIDIDKDTTTKLLTDLKNSVSSAEDLELKLFETDSNGETALYKILKNNSRCHVFEAFWSIVKNSLSVEKQRQLFNVMSDDPSNILLAAAMNESCDMMKPLMNILTIIYDPNEMREIFLRKFDKSQTILHVIGRHNNNSSVTETIIEECKQRFTIDEQKELLTTADSDSNIVLHTYAIFNKYFFQFIINYIYTMFSISEQEEIFMLCNASSKNILTCSTSNPSSLFRHVWAHILNKFRMEVLIKLLSQCDVDGFNAIQLMILENDDFCVELLSWFRDSCPDYKNILLQKVKSKPFLSLVASSCQNHIIIIYCKFLKENFRDLKEIILDKDGAGNNVFMYAARNKFDKSFETILNFLSETLTKGELLQLITDKNMFASTILNVIKIDATHEIFRNFCIGYFGEETFDNVIPMSKKRRYESEAGECSKKSKG